MQATEKPYYTPEKYLELEVTADYKSEYIDGQIIPMAGGTVNHNRIAGNLYAALNTAFIEQEEYEAFNSDMRLWINQKRIYTYPDIVVIAGEPEFYNNRTDIITNPQVVIEVLSKSTKGYDREDKFTAYRTISTFQEYLLIEQNRIYIEQFSKTGKKQWNLREYDEEDEKISFVSVPFEISIKSIYKRVKFEIVESDT
ncbi:MAG TPA: Uma2 family endonuclease [Nostocaceae cyanobacterium]|nr:Uma2 family endonuclease [Nostocaceae cyanobacterium]